MHIKLIRRRLRNKNCAEVNNYFFLISLHNANIIANAKGSFVLRTTFQNRTSLNQNTPKLEMTNRKELVKM